MHDKLTYRPAQNANRGFLLWLEEAAMKAHATALWGSWRPSASVETLDISGTQIIERGGAPIGCLTTRMEKRALYLARLFIAPDFQNMGLGRAVLDMVLAKADAGGYPVRLSVLSTNRAVAFYQRAGFAVEHETAERIGLIYKGPSAPQP